MSNQLAKRPSSKIKSNVAQRVPKVPTAAVNVQKKNRSKIGDTLKSGKSTLKSTSEERVKMLPLPYSLVLKSPYLLEYAFPFKNELSFDFSIPSDVLSGGSQIFSPNDSGLEMKKMIMPSLFGEVMDMPLVKNLIKYKGIPITNNFIINDFKISKNGFYVGFKFIF